jgi:hypothetical protein
MVEVEAGRSKNERDMYYSWEALTKEPQMSLSPTKCKKVKWHYKL